MSNIKEQLLTAYNLEKAAYVNYVTSFSGAGISALVRGGLDFEKASQLVKEACEKDLTASSLKANVLAFEKTAEYIEELESKISELEKVAEHAEEVIAADPNNPLSKLAAAGFTEEEIEYMNTLPDTILEKVASNNAQPWEMGSGVGIPREKTDPLLEFILG